jgi:hypothetical protein
MVLRGQAVSDIALIAILLAAFALAIGLVRALGRLIDSDAPDGWADEPLDTPGPSGRSHGAIDRAL